jgi:hypothetical protein
MADEWKSFFNSDDGDSEFEGFSLSDIDEAETRSIGSDISISEVDYEGIPTIENTTWIPKNAIISGKVVGTHTLSGRT